MRVVLSRRDLESLLESEFGSCVFVWRRCSHTGPLVIMDIDTSPEVVEGSPVVGFAFDGEVDMEDEDLPDGGPDPSCKQRGG